jgi:hypothetical protein
MICWFNHCAGQFGGVEVGVSHAVVLTGDLSLSLCVRSLGDAVAHTAGVSSEPEVFERRIDSSKEHFVVSTASETCDGHAILD